MFNIFKISTSARFFLSINLWPKKYSTQSFKPFYENFFKYSGNIAVIDRLGYYSYQDILHTSCLVAKKLNAIMPNSSEISERITFLCPNEAIYVSVLLACWITGNVAVPLSSNHPKTLLEYIITNSQSSILIASSSFSDMAQNISTQLKIKHIIVDSIVKGSMKNLDPAVHSSFFSWDSSLRERKALIIYTSGTTGLPKGVALSHGNLFAQVSSLVKAWKISSHDTILHTLPLYHMHGIMNALLCLLSVGGTVVMRPKFNASEVWSYFMNKYSSNTHISLFFGVPTMYVMLIDAYQKMLGREHIKRYCKENIRLMTCGSAPLPESVFHEWEKITGHYLLERFGMSEIGMALSNPLNGPRIPGSVGNPLPTVEVKIVEDSSSLGSVTYVEGNDSFVNVSPDCKNKEGELLVRGPTVFKEYWNNEKATIEAFTHDGWFKTGDTSTYKNGSFKILGRMSADIIKSAGYKISALAIESCLLTHPQIIDCSVMGIPDETWGERVAALIVAKDNKGIKEAELKAWCEKTLPSYTVPSVVKYVNIIPRNPMGKMNKKELKKMFS